MPLKYFVNRFREIHQSFLWLRVYLQDVDKYIHIIHPNISVFLRFMHMPFTRYPQRAVHSRGCCFGSKWRATLKTVKYVFKEYEKVEG